MGVNSAMNRPQDVDQRSESRLHAIQELGVAFSTVVSELWVSLQRHEGRLRVSKRIGTTLAIEAREDLLKAFSKAGSAFLLRDHEKRLQLILDALFNPNP